MNVRCGFRSVKTISTIVIAFASIAIQCALSTPAKAWSYNTNYGGWTWLYSGKYAWTNDPWGSPNYQQASQVLQINAIWQDTNNITHVQWKTTWNWTDGTGGIKAYPNVGFSYNGSPSEEPDPPNGQYTFSGNDNLPRGMWVAHPIPSHWKFHVLKLEDNMDVAYDIFTSDGSEIMVWLYKSDASIKPISFNYSGPGYPAEIVASPTFNGVKYNLSVGNKGQNVYSFIVDSSSRSVDANGWYDTESGFDLWPFLNYCMYSMPTLSPSGKALPRLSSSQYLYTIQAGAEITKGSGGLYTSDYATYVIP